MNSPTTPRARRRASTFHRFGWLAVVALTAAALFATPGVALGHDAVPECGGYLDLDWPSDTADITRTDVDPDVLVHDNVPGDGKYAVEPGTYTIQWADGYAVTSVTVAACPANDKVFICKYVGTPGVDETLQTGQNPISVSVNAIKVQPIVVGAFFADDQGRSYVLAYDTGQPEPPVSSCPPPDGPLTGSITFIKAISSDNEGPAALGDFKLTFGSIGEAEHNQVISLDFDDWEVGEDLSNGPANYKFVSTLCEPNEPDDSLVARVASNVAFLSEDYPDWTCTVTNEYVPPTVTSTVDFRCNVVGAAYFLWEINLAGDALNHPFGWSLSADFSNSTIVQVNPAQSTYFVTTPSGWPKTLYVRSVSLGAATPAWSASADEGLCAKVDLLKTVVNTGGGTKVAGDFTLRLTDADDNVYSGESGQHLFLLPGVYDLSEASFPGYVFDGGRCTQTNGDQFNDGMVGLGVGEEWTCTYVNTYSPTPTPTPTPVVTTPPFIPFIPAPLTPVVTPTPTPVVTTPPTATPTGTVEAATATPTGTVEAVTSQPQVTPPPTDALGTTGQASGDSWRIALLAIAGLLATLLLLTPVVPARTRHR